MHWLLPRLEIDLFGKSDREIKNSFGFSGRFTDLVAHELRCGAGALVAADGLEKFVQWDPNAADLFVAECGL